MRLVLALLVLSTWLVFSASSFASESGGTKRLFLAATIVIVGFYLNTAILVGNIAGLALGYIPGIKDHLIWWILVVGTALGIVLDVFTKWSRHPMVHFAGSAYWFLNLCLPSGASFSAHAGMC